MALIACEECGAKVSTDAVVCTQCGFPRKKSRGFSEFLERGFPQIVALLSVLGLLSGAIIGYRATIDSEALRQSNQSTLQTLTNSHEERLQADSDKAKLRETHYQALVNTYQNLFGRLSMRMNRGMSIPPSTSQQLTIAWRASRATWWP